MKAFLSICASLFAAATLSAQGPELSAATNVGVFVKSGNQQPVYQFIKSGTKAGLRGLHVQANVRGVGSASAMATLVKTREGLTGKFNERGAIAVATAKGSAHAGTSAAADARKLAQGPHAFRVMIPAKKGSKAKMLLTWTATAATGASSTVAVDFGGDKIVDFKGAANAQPVRKSFDVVAGDKGFVYIVIMDAKAAISGIGRTGYGAELGIVFAPASGGGQCSVAPYGRSCSLLSGIVRSDTRVHEIFMKLQGGVPNSVGVNFIGTKQISHQIGRSSCFVLTDFIFIGSVFRTDTRGNAAHSLKIPRGLAITATLQDFTIGRNMLGLMIKSSNGLMLKCSK